MSLLLGRAVSFAELPVAEGATTPAGSQANEVVFSTVTGALMRWNGTSWTANLVGSAISLLAQYEASDMHATSPPNTPFTGNAISTGTIATAPANALLDPNHPGVLLARSSTTANSGYRLQTGAPLVGGVGLYFRAIVAFQTAFANNTVRLGFHDSTTSADAVDGAYLEVSATGVASFKTSNNSTRTTHGTTLTLALNTWYTVDIEYVAAVQVRCVIRDDAGTVLLDVTNTTNVPNTAARAFNAGIVGTNSGTTASDVYVIDYAGVGRKVPVAAGSSNLRTINAQTGTTYTLSASDIDDLVTLTNAAAITLTVPADSTHDIPAGAQIDLAQNGAGQVTISPAGGVTIKPSAELKTRTNGSCATLTYLGGDVWLVAGDLVA